MGWPGFETIDHPDDSKEVEKLRARIALLEAAIRGHRTATHAVLWPKETCDRDRKLWEVLND